MYTALVTKDGEDQLVKKGVTFYRGDNEVLYCPEDRQEYDIIVLLSIDWLSDYNERLDEDEIQPGCCVTYNLGFDMTLTITKTERAFTAVVQKNSGEYRQSQLPFDTLQAVEDYVNDEMIKCHQK